MESTNHSPPPPRDVRSVPVFCLVRERGGGREGEMVSPAVIAVMVVVMVVVVAVAAQIFESAQYSKL